jgi:hypothetical protein
VNVSAPAFDFGVVPDDFTFAGAVVVDFGSFGSFFGASATTGAASGVTGAMIWLGAASTVTVDA